MSEHVEPIFPAGWPVDGWQRFCGLLRRDWPGEFTVADANTYAVVLNGYSPDEVAQAYAKLQRPGRIWRPKPHELRAALHDDPSQPTFAEALRMIQMALKARPPRDARYDDDPEPADGEPRPPGWRSAERKRQDAERQAVNDVLSAIHPLAAAFAHRQGIDRLRAMRLDDPDWGEKRRADLKAEWDAHVEAFDARKVAALAAGDRRGQLSRFDPLAAFEPPQRQITTGGEVQ